MNTPNFNRVINKRMRKDLIRINKTARINSFKRQRGKDALNIRGLLFIYFNGKCFWCGEEVIEYKIDGAKEKLPKNQSTVDHVVSRYFRKKGEDVIKVLACYRCNLERCELENLAHKENKLEKLSPYKIFGLIVD